MSDLVTYSKSLINNTAVPLIDYLRKSWVLDNTYINRTGTVPSINNIEIASSPASVSLSPVNTVDAAVPCIAGIDQISKYSKYLVKWVFNKGIYNFCSLLNLPISTYALDIQDALTLLTKYTHTSIVADLLFLEESGLRAEREAPAVSSYEIEDFVADTDLGVSREEYLGLELGSSWSVELFFRFESGSDEGSLLYVPGHFRAYVDSSQDVKVEVFDVGTVEGVPSVLATEYNKLEISRFDQVYKIFLNGTCLGVYKKESSETLDIYAGYYLHSEDSLSSTTFTGLFRNLQVYAGFPNYYQYQFYSPNDPDSLNTELFYTFFIGEDERELGTARSFTSDTSVEPFIASGMLNEYSHFELDGSQVEIEGNFTLEAEILNTSGNTRGTIALYGESNEFNWSLGVYDSKARFEIGGITLESTSDISTSNLTLVTAERDANTIRLYVNGVVEDSDTYTGDTIAFTGKTLRIKRKEGQASAIATTNSTVYPSKSRLFIRTLRYTSSARFSGNYAPIKGFIYG